MNKEEFFDALDKLLRSYRGIRYYNLYYHISQLLKPDPLNNENQTYLAEYLVNPNYKQPDYNQTKIFWYLADRFNNIPLMDTLIELNEDKLNNKLLVNLLANYFYTAFGYAIQLYHDKDNNPDDLFNLFYLIIDRYNYNPPDFNDQAINNLFNTINLKALSEAQTSNLLYLAIIAKPKIAEILIRRGWDPFDNYWKEDVNTGVPILFEAVQNNDTFDFIEQHNDTQKWWNTTDQWGKNLLHFVVKNKRPDKKFYDLLIEKGVDPDHRALIDDNKLTLAKIKRQPIPPEYGKTPRELLEERKQS